MDTKISAEEVNELGKTLFSKVTLTFAKHVLTEFEKFVKSAQPEEASASLSHLLKSEFANIPTQAGALPIFGDNAYSCIGISDKNPPRPESLTVKDEHYELCMSNLRKLTIHYWKEYFEASAILGIIHQMYPSIQIDNLTDYDGVLKFHPEQQFGIVAYTYLKQATNE